MIGLIDLYHVSTFVTVPCSFAIPRLDWELYFFLFTLNCIWLILQAIVAAVRAARRARNFPITAFFEGTMSGTWPVIADSYDTLKDVLVPVPALRQHFSQGVRGHQLAVPGSHLFIMDDRCCAELLGSYAPILVMHTTSSNRVDGDLDDSSCCSKMCSKIHDFLKGMRDTLIVQIYRQVTPVKRYLLAVENIFQGLVGIVPRLHQVCRMLWRMRSFTLEMLTISVGFEMDVFALMFWRFFGNLDWSHLWILSSVWAVKAYMIIEGGSVFVALLNVVIPIIQIFLTFSLHKPLRLQVEHLET